MTVQLGFLDKLVKGKVQEVTDLLQAVRKVYCTHYKPLTSSGDALRQLLDEHLPLHEAASFKRQHPLLFEQGV